VLDQRGRLLRAALEFAGLPRPSYDRALWALRTWLDSWSGIGRIADGMARQGYDLQLTRYDERGWRATFYTTGMEHSPHQRDGHRVGADAVVRGAECGVGCAEQNSEHAGTMTAPADLEEFVTDHRPHGPLTADATEPEWSGYLLTVDCPCGVTFERWVAPEDAELDLLQSAGRPLGHTPPWEAEHGNNSGCGR